MPSGCNKLLGAEARSGTSFVSDQHLLLQCLILAYIILPIHPFLLKALQRSSSILGPPLKHEGKRMSVIKSMIDFHALNSDNF